MSLKFIVLQATGGLEEYMEAQHGRIARAATRTMKDVKDLIVKDGRDNIASAGFPRSMQNALRGVVFPRRGNSINAAAWIWHRVHYAGLFEDGGTISGSPMLWLPLSTTMPKLGRQKISPSLLVQKGVELVSLKSKRGTPLLGARVKVPKSRVGGVIKPTLGMLRRGTSGTRGVEMAIPLFHGIKQVSINKKTDVRGVAKKVSRQIPARLLSYFMKEPV